ncbi:NAD(P)(+)--arginine ADP-ribosyltransferase 1-like [Salminus brasiliensis]|uniref:NAD(P)(+)--arginine ADP-ribosyltransferase 1-like n=1 Tax=Salminus brasiliensis TaxID=930266 RepID=UPI003B8333B2
MMMTVSVVSVLFLLTVSLSAEKSSADVLPLDMAKDSVDDAYDGCKDAMNKVVLSKYMEHEKKNTPGFSAAWNNALNKCSKDGLDKNQSAAIYLYTGNPEKNKNCSFREFNTATRNGKKAYKSENFKFYTLFFFLTDAVQQLNQKQNACLTTYRRTNVTFQTDVFNKTVRFGSFTSTSLNNDSVRFGNRSCFEIYTCFGASVQNYSKFQHESEVLIPPYEVFNVTSIEKKTWCEVVYKLNSSETKRSDLNCAKIVPS